jgi:hypothetical protein
LLDVGKATPILDTLAVYFRVNTPRNPLELLV